MITPVQLKMLTRQEALELAFTEQLPQQTYNGQDYLILPSQLFYEAIGITMPELPEVDFYSYETDSDPELFREKSEGFSLLALSNQELLCVRAADVKAIKTYAESQLLDLSTTTKVPPEQRIATLRRTAVLVMDDLFNDPSPENISRSSKVVGSFVYVIMKDPSAYLFLAKLSSHDPYTLQHSVGTAVNSIILGRKIGITDETELTELGMAGLLHDIGKTKIDSAIINKEGPLNDDEWVEMKKHPQYGYELVKDHPEIAESTKRAILEHHEQPDQKGYPKQIPYDQVHLFAKIVCLSDIFNALITDRPYSKAISPFEAFKLIKLKISHKVDPELLNTLIRVYGGDI